MSRTGGLSSVSPWDEGARAFLFPAIGDDTQVFRVAPDHQKRQAEIEHQHHEADPEVGGSPAIVRNERCEQRDKGKLPQAIAGQGKADGKASSFLKPLAHESGENRNRRSSQAHGGDNPVENEEMPERLRQSDEHVA